MKVTYGEMDHTATTKSRIVLGASANVVTAGEITKRR
jgi:hypothetical protein